MLTKQEVKELLLEKYENTGRICFNQIRSKKKALALIETIAQLYEDEPEDTTEEKVVVSLKDMSDKFKSILNDF